MRAVILAAGRARRLRPITDRMPKCMVPVLGTPMLTTMLESLAEVGVTEVVLVVGYRADDIRHTYGDAFGSIRLVYVENPDYETTNNLYSLWLAREYLNQDLLLLESDLVVPGSVLVDLVACGRANVAVTDDFRPPMNGTVVIADGAVSREMVLGRDQGEGFDYGEAEKTVNIYRLSGRFLRDAFAAVLDARVHEGRTGDYYEAVFADLIAAGRLELGLVRMDGRPWAEIDSPEDLRLAEETFAAYYAAAG